MNANKESPGYTIRKIRYVKVGQPVHYYTARVIAATWNAFLNALPKTRGRDE